MTIAARRSLQVAGRHLTGDIRLARVAGTLAVSLLGLLLVLHVPPFMAAGADLTDSVQRDYAANIWQETQTSLGLVILVLPWLVYGLLWQGAPWGRRTLLVVATVAVVVTTWLALLSAQSYAALPRQVTGVVDRVQGRAVWLTGGSSYYVVVSDTELRSAESWLRPGANVTMWVSPRGHAGAVNPAGIGD